MRRWPKLTLGLLMVLILAACGSAAPAPSGSTGPQGSAEASPSSSTTPGTSAQPAAFIWNASLAGWQGGKLVMSVASWNAQTGDPTGSALWAYDPGTKAWARLAGPTGLHGLFIAATTGTDLAVIDESDPPLMAVQVGEQAWQSVGDTPLSGFADLVPLDDARLFAAGATELDILTPARATWETIALPGDYVVVGAAGSSGRWLLAPVDDAAREGGLGSDFHLLAWDQGASVAAAITDHASAVANLGDGDTLFRTAAGWQHLDLAGKPVRVAAAPGAGPFTYFSDDRAAVAYLDCHSDAVPIPTTDDCALSIGPVSGLKATVAAFGRRNVLGVRWGAPGLALLSGSRDGQLSALELVLVDTTGSAQVIPMPPGVDQLGP